MVLALMAGCQSAGIQTYPVTPAQLDCARTCFSIPACPTGKTNVAGLVSTDAGAVVTVKCDAGSVFK